MNENLRGLFGGAIFAYIPLNACDIRYMKQTKIILYELPLLAKHYPNKCLH
jgi:hypothetical protein